jgi:hypothetical protein
MKLFFGRTHFFLEDQNLGRYVGARKGEGEVEERDVNNLLIDWTLSHVSLAGRMRRPMHEDFLVRLSPESATDVAMGKCSCTAV